MKTLTDTTTDELLVMLGDDVKRLRLDRNIAQTDLARQAGISRTALVNLETGAGATLSTLVRVLRVLGREEWLGTLAPKVTVSPIDVMRLGHQRQRASGERQGASTTRRDGPVQPLDQ